MEIQAPTHQEMTKLLSNTLKIILVALGRAVSNTSKLILIDLEYLFKQGNTLAQKAIRKFLNLRHNHHTAATALSCRPSDADNYLSSFISPRDYQFSCSSSPIIRRRSKYRSHNYRYNVHHVKRSSQYYNGVSAVEAVDKVLELLNRGERVIMGNESPELELPGFEKSPMVARQLRVTDSPFRCETVDVEMRGVVKWIRRRKSL
ncbi:hypothetical protein QQ045_010049 [Rhodiola kirilowii]